MIITVQSIYRKAGFKYTDIVTNKVKFALHLCCNGHRVLAITDGITCRLIFPVSGLVKKHSNVKLVLTLNV